MCCCSTTQFGQNAIVALCKLWLEEYQIAVERNREKMIVEAMRPRSWIKTFFWGRAAKTREQAIKKIRDDIVTMYKYDYPCDTFNRDTIKNLLTLAESSYTMVTVDSDTFAILSRNPK